MKSIVWLVLLTAASGFAQSYKTCDVTMWANETYSHTAPATPRTFIISFGLEE